MQQQELTSKQQAVELIKQAKHILLVTGRQPNNDQIGAMVALELILQRAGKQVNAIATGEMPKIGKVLDTNNISRDLNGIRDFIISLDTSQVEVDKLRYEVNENSLDVIISPFAGNFTAQDASFNYGAYKFDLVIVLGVSQIAKIDMILEQNPTIFDGLHLINIDSHRSNEQYGSVNFIEPQASSICEMLVGVIESVAQGMIDDKVATALLAGIMSSTQGFTGPNTTAKSLTIAAQMMSGGARQQEIVRALFTGSKGAQNVQNQEQSNVAAINQPQVFHPESKPKPAQPEPKLETVAEKLARQGVELTPSGVVMQHETITSEVVEDVTTIYEPESSSEDQTLDATQDQDSNVDNPSSKPDEGKQNIKKFANPVPTESLPATSKASSKPAKSSRSKKK